MNRNTKYNRIMAKYSTIRKEELLKVNNKVNADKKAEVKEMYRLETERIEIELKEFRNDPVLLRKKRAELIIKLVNEDYSYNSIAVFFGVSKQRIFQLIRKYKKEQEKSLI